MPPRFAALFKDVRFVQEQTLQGRNAVNLPLVANLIDLAFGFVNQANDVISRDVGVVNNLSRHGDQSTLLGLLTYEFGVVLRIRCRRRIHLQ